jgi:hypothetical protein
MMLSKFHRRDFPEFDFILFLFRSAIYEKIMEHLQLYYDFKQNSVPQRRVRFPIV